MLNNLPPEIATLCFGFLPLPDIYSARLICRSLSTLASLSFENAIKLLISDNRTDLVAQSVVEIRSRAISSDSAAVHRYLYLDASTSTSTCYPALPPTNLGRLLAEAGLKCTHIGFLDFCSPRTAELTGGLLHGMMQGVTSSELRSVLDGIPFRGLTSTAKKVSDLLDAANLDEKIVDIALAQSGFFSKEKVVAIGAYHRTRIFQLGGKEFEAAVWDMIENLEKRIGIGRKKPSIEVAVGHLLREFGTIEERLKVVIALPFDWFGKGKAVAYMHEMLPGIDVFPSDIFTILSALTNRVTKFHQASRAFFSGILASAQLIDRSGKLSRDLISGFFYTCIWDRGHRLQAGDFYEPKSFTVEHLQHLFEEEEEEGMDEVRERGLDWKALGSFLRGRGGEKEMLAGIDIRERGEIKKLLGL